ncbi:MAG: hypothetical protein RL443_975, partial [Actinomycetota bacterium]
MKVALVTGGATGIGAATVEALAAEGIAVAIQYSSSKAQAEGLASKLKLAGSKVEIFQSDLTKSDSANTLVSDVKKSLGEIDILINNAGLMSDASIIQMSDQLWDEAININLTASFKLMRACAP